MGNPKIELTSFKWHPATMSPGTKRVLMAFLVKGHEAEYFTFEVIRFVKGGAVPASCAFETSNGTKKLAVAWAYYDDIVKNIADWMVVQAADVAWAWWNDENKPK